jgi:hypothetical protein
MGNRFLLIAYCLLSIAYCLKLTANSSFPVPIAGLWDSIMLPAGYYQNKVAGIGYTGVGSSGLNLIQK